jgi:hypothetical protein
MCHGRNKRNHGVLDFFVLLSLIRRIRGGRERVRRARLISEYSELEERVTIGADVVLSAMTAGEYKNLLGWAQFEPATCTFSTQLSSTLIYFVQNAFHV